MPPKFTALEIIVSFCLSSLLFLLYLNASYLTGTFKNSVQKVSNIEINTSKILGYDRDSVVTRTAEEDVPVLVGEEDDTGTTTDAKTNTKGGSSDGGKKPATPVVDNSNKKKERGYRKGNVNEHKPYLNTMRLYEQPKEATEEEQAFLTSCKVAESKLISYGGPATFELCVQPKTNFARRTTYALVRRIAASNKPTTMDTIPAGNHNATSTANYLPELRGVCVSSDARRIRVAMKNKIVNDVSHILLSFIPPYAGDYVCTITLEYADVIGVTESFVVRGAEVFVDHWPHLGSNILYHTFTVKEPTDGLAERTPCIGFQKNMEGYWIDASVEHPDTESWSNISHEVGMIWQPLECRLDFLGEETAIKLLAGRKIALLGDSMMRTTFQAIIEILTSGKNPYKGQYPGVDKWCGRHVSNLRIGKGILNIFGDGCHGGGATFILPDTHTELHYFSSFQAIHPVIRKFVDGLDALFHKQSYDLILAGYGLHDVNYPISTFHSDMFRVTDSLRSVHEGPILFLGVWAQNIARKPIEWKWSGSHTKTRAVDVSTQFHTSRVPGFSYIHSFDMMYSRIDETSDGVHYTIRSTLPLANLIIHDLGLLLVGSHGSLTA